MSIVITLFALALLFTGYNTQINSNTDREAAFSSSTRDIPIQALARDTQYLTSQGFSQKDAINIASENVKTKLSALTLSDKLYKSVSKEAMTQALSKFDKQTLTKNFTELSSSVSDEIRLGIITDILINTSIASPKIQNKINHLFKNKSYNVALVAANPETVKSQPDSKQIKKYYDTNKHRFQNPVKVSLDYVLFDAKKIKISTPNTKTLSAFYEKNKSYFTTKLTETIEVKTTETPNNKNRLPNEIAQSLNELKKSIGKDTINTQSKIVDIKKLPNHIQKSLRANGLTHWTPDDHSFTLYYLKKPTHLSFHNLRKDIIEYYNETERKKLIQNYYTDVSELAYTSSESIAPIASQYHLTIMHTPLFSPDNVSTIPKPFNNKILSSLKNDDMLINNYNSEAIRLSDDEFIVYRINEKVPASQMTYNQAKPSIIRILSTQLGQEKILKATKLSNIDAVSAYLQIPPKMKNHILLNSKSDRSLLDIILACNNKQICNIQKDGFTYFGSVQLVDDSKANHQPLTLKHGTVISFSKQMIDSADIKTNPSIISYLQQ